MPSVLVGLLLTMQHLPYNSIVFALSDNPTKNLDLKDEIIRLKDEKNIHIFIVLTPRYHGIVGDKSWQVKHKMALTLQLILRPPLNYIKLCLLLLIPSCF